MYNPSGPKVQISGIEFKKGEIVVNNKPINEYFRFSAYGPRYNKFLEDTNALGNYVFTIKVEGGGLSGQLDAALLGMARALDKLDREKFHTTLRSKGYLTRDPRTRERRKVGMGGKARRRKQSPKR
ncbi:MAG: 30S ribosomal protein S9 [Candidatus Levybacteria bacterium RIFCSPHIGHO2_01_FULL_40_15b]|nr:MAG: 30S ribosomal protein S9 [Candidatus Levybacteria bacterium RIFCSPHIGHO2_01_FULL_40_15b]